MRCSQRNVARFGTVKSVRQTMSRCNLSRCDSKGPSSCIATFCYSETPLPNVVDEWPGYRGTKRALYGSREHSIDLLGINTIFDSTMCLLPRGEHFYLRFGAIGLDNDALNCFFLQGE